MKRELVRVNPQKTHKTRNNLIKTLFRAIKSLWRCFSVSDKAYFEGLVTSCFATISPSPASLKRSLFSINNSLTPVFFTLFLIASFALIAHTLFSQSEKSRIPFGRSETINVYPSHVESSNWLYPERAATQDLSEDAIYQNFDGPEVSRVPRTPGELKAYFDKLKETEDRRQLQLEERQFLIESGQVIPETVEQISTTSENTTDRSTPTTTTDTDVSPPADTENMATSSVSFLRPIEHLFTSTFAVASRQFAFLQESTTTPIAQQADLSVAETTVTTTSTVPVEPESVVEPIPTSTSVVDTTPVLFTPTTTPASTTESVSELNTDTIEPVETLTEVSTTTSVIELPVEENEVQIITATSSVEAENDVTAYELTLSDFSVPELQRGQFVVSSQLRLSFAAKLKNFASTSVEEVEVLFGQPDNLTSVGTILIDGEVSNALNGGYFLFALPITGVSEVLADAQVVVRYSGEQNILQGMYLDAAWVEMNTKIITKEDIENRGKADQLKKLKLPEIYELVSDTLNFKRNELPVFNLRYQSQRNTVVRGVRSFFGRDLVKVNSVEIKHSSLGLVGVAPEINTTNEGLITITIPEKDRSKLRPGQYTVIIESQEGGEVYEDSFDFQWGILSINPDKTEYEVGEEAFVSMGALTPKGHTICQTDLSLYVTNPSGIVDKVVVEESGYCDGNNVIDVPDFSSAFTVNEPGPYELYLERLDKDGTLLGFTTDTFSAVSNQDLSIKRYGPSRIYPPASYPMQLTVSSDKGFDGTLVERVPLSFDIDATSAEVTESDGWKILTWDMSIPEGGSRTVSYTFNAPDYSPYLFYVGPALLTGSSKQLTQVQTASTSSSSVSAVPSQSEADFVEHRQWQIASDVPGKMILFWDGGITPPTDWVCLSCGSGDFYQKHIMGSSTYGANGGTYFHNHSVTADILPNTAATVESGTGGPAINTHDHTLNPAVSNAINLPASNELRVIRYDVAAGEPPIIPAGAIAIFDVASSSLPTDWNRYAAQDGLYVFGGNAPGTATGTNTHTHDVTGTSGASTGGTARTRGAPTQTTAAADGHTHTFSTTTVTVNNEPPYITVLLAKATVDVTFTNGIIAMWDVDVDDGWIDLSSDPSSDFSNRFIKASTIYGTTNGTTSHTHVDISNANTSGPNTTTNGVLSGTPTGSDPNHQHNTNLTDFSLENHLPPYVTVVYGRRQGTDPVYDQTSYAWYANDENEEEPTDPWPQGGTLDLVESEPITSTSTPVKPGDEVRLRINAGVTNATSTAGSRFKLQFAAADVCSAASSWVTVGDTSSSTVWRGYNNSGVTDHVVLSTTVLASSTVEATYEENGYATGTPSDIEVGEYGEWDFVLQHNGAAAGTNYCFRMIQDDGTTFISYSDYPQLFTNETPEIPTLLKLFDNEKTASNTPYFRFTTTDNESNTIHYLVEVNDDPTFTDAAEYTVDSSDEDDSDFFTDLTLTTAKAPYVSGHIIEFRPETSLATNTYYWRVRAQDPTGSGYLSDWSEVRSFTIDQSLDASAWFQTQDEQFDTNTLEGVETGSDELSFIVGSTTGTTTSSLIDFDAGDRGTAWKDFDFNDTGSITYFIEYYDGTSWLRIPDADLTSNSSGFTSVDAPVSLLSLDTDTYNDIRIVAVFTNTSAPSLQDWTINWGYRVETPVINKTFPNERVGTTTPTFEFYATDPQNDALTYQVQFSEQYDFTASTTYISDADDTFENSEDGGDVSDPFNSGDVIRFVPSAPLNGGTTTYWIRVRAKDTDGANAYSFWSEPQSFTIATPTEVSTWYQTTEEQFDTNILSGTQANAADAVSVATTASEALLVYGEGISNVPKYRQWDGTSWSAQADMLDVGSPIKWSVVKAGVAREEYIAVTVGTDNDVNAQIFSTGDWGNLRELTTSMGNINARGFDVAYETLTGNAMVAYCDGDADPSYYTWDGFNWATTGSINLSSANNCEWIKMASDPFSNEIIILSRDSTGGQYEAQVWNGTAWGNATVQGSISESDHEGMAVEYEQFTGGQAIITTSDGNPARMRWNSWNGSTWGTAAVETLGDDLEWGKLVGDAGSDELVLCLQNDDIDVEVIRWTGAAWAGRTALTADANAKNDPGFGCVFEDGGTRDNYIMVVYSDTTQVSSSSWNNTAWSAGTQINSITQSATMDIERTGSGDLLSVFFNHPNDRLLFSKWGGSSWSSTQVLEADMSVDNTPYGQPYDLAPRNSGTEGTTIVSPGIDFNDGSGPYWQEFSWNDSQTGASEILYQMQYQTSTGSWAFIPDVDLPGNGAGTTTGPYDLRDLNTTTYNVIRPYASLTCEDADNCPTLFDWTVTWAGGLTVSGTLQEYDETTNVTGGTVEVAVNGVYQSGKTGTVSGGTWSIPNVTVFPGDVVTVFYATTSNQGRAVGVTRYGGIGDIEGMQLFYRHLTLGSNDATSTPLTNADIGGYDFSTNPTDIFFDVNGTTLTACAASGCGDVELYINASTTYTPGGNIVTHDFENNGTFTSGANIVEINGSWDNNATSTMTGSTVVFAATSTIEDIDNTGATVSSFNDVIFGTTTGSGTWTVSSALDINGDLTVTRGTLARGTAPITIAGDLVNGASGQWSGVGTTTFDGSGSVSWGDQNATLQNVGNVVVDGSTKTVVLSNNVAAQSITIGANDTLDASNFNYDITVYGNWDNNNNFLARAGEVFFAATSTGQNITTAGDAFYDLSFTGADGGWSFTESTLLVNNDFTISTGTVTLPTTGTTTIAGSFDSTGGQFSHNNGVLYFTSSGAETITFDGSGFINPANDITFNGGGSWVLSDTHATATGNVRVRQGAVTLPSGVFAIEGALTDEGGSFTGNGGTVLFYSSGSETLQAGGSSFASIVFDGTGDWTFSDTNVTATGDLTIEQGTFILPSGIFTLGGSYSNNASVTAGTGEVLFNSSDSGETINFGNSPLYDVTIDSATGGWTITADATTTNDFVLSTSSDFTLSSGQILAVGGIFTNTVGGASTTWTGSTLSLLSGTYTINNNGETGDAYETLVIAPDTDIAMWNSVATTPVVDSTGSLYSQDHNAVDGDLYIFGDYNRTSGTEYWSYDTDFDGTDLTGNERQVDVRLAAGTTVSVVNATTSIVGDSAASTTVANQGSGTYTISITGGTTTAQYYEFSDLGLSGVSLLGGTIVQTLDNGSYIAGINGGTAITLSSTTIDANAAKQIFSIQFATTSAISADNVTQTDGAPISYWWFRNGTGNLYGEEFDNDTGNPGSVRFDDSALNLTISGVVYENDRTTPITGATCDDSTPVVRVMVNGSLSTTVPCSSADGTYSASGVVVVGDPTVTIFLSGAPGGEQASVITRTPTGDITNLDLYANHVIVRNEDTSALTISNLAVYDGTDNADLQFTAATSSTPDSFVVKANNSLYVFASSTFTPGGEVTLNGNANANDYDGTLYIAGDATFNAFSSSTLTIAGRMELGTGATFNAASTTALFTATTTGKSITSPAAITFTDLIFNGVSGGWNIGADISVTQNMVISTGTVTGTGDITVVNGSLTGNGTLSLGAGTTTMERTNTLGGTTAWTFYDLVLGNGLVVGTTTPAFTATTTISGHLVIANAHFLDAGSSKWDLAGSGTVFTETGTFLEDTSTIRYSGSSSNVLDTQYYNLDINAGAGTPTYTAINAGLIVDNNLTIGGDATTVFDINTNDPSLDVNGNILIRSNGTLSASDSTTLTVAGSYDNNGVFTSNNGTITFDGSGAVDIAAGASTFGTAEINGSGDFTVSESATSTSDFTLTAHNTFTLGSGEVLAVGGEFTNTLGGAPTTWTGSTLKLYSGTDYEINAKVVTDSYETLSVAANTQIRMWGSDATTYDVSSTGSLYSMDHAGQDGDLYIFGAYTKTNADDYWDYANDFDGVALGGSSRTANVYIATSSSVSITGGSLHIKGATNASTTIESTATDLYGFTIAGTASTSMRNYVFRDMDEHGIVFSGTPEIETLSNGIFELAVTGTSAVKVAGSVITNNPAKTFNFNQFTLGDAASGFNVEVIGSALSAWRFFGHAGGIDGEDYDIDSGDPGEILWDNSTSTIDISGRVFEDEGSTVSAACGGGSNIHLYVNGSLENTTSCDSGTGFYTFSDVSYSAGESVVIYINNAAQNAVTVSTDLVSTVSNYDLYEDRLIVRHESTSPIEIPDLDDWDSDDDPADIFFDAEVGPNTLTLNSDTKLIIWDSKEFEPGGDITTGGGAGDALDGTVALQDDATLTLGSGESHSIGGNLEMGTNADLTPAQSTVTFTSSGSGRTIDTNEDGFYNLVVSGSGSYSSTDTELNIANDLTFTSGTLTLPAATTTISGSLSTTAGSFDANGGTIVFDSSAAETVVASTSSFGEILFSGSGSWSMNDTNATATESVIVQSGTVTLPSGVLSVGGDFRNTGGTVTHNTSNIVLRNGVSGVLLASSSDLYSVTVASTGAYVMEDTNISLVGSLLIDDGSLVLASGTLSIGGSFIATGGTFSYTNPNATNTILFNSGDSGETINPGVSSFETIQVGAPSGGYTITGNATTTDDFFLLSANDFTVQSGVIFYVGGTFLNSVGGSATTWNGSTLVLDGENQTYINTKGAGGDEYDTLVIGAESDIEMWNSRATTTTVDSSSSLYSQDHDAVDGALYIYGDYHIGTTTEYWSYDTDFDSTDLSGGSERAVTVSISQNSTTSVDGGTLEMVGVSGNETTVTNQGSGNYSFNVSGGTFNAQYYAFRNLNSTGLNLSGTPVITSLNYGDYELAVNGGSLISLSSTTLNANASLIITGNQFATTTAITGNNVSLTGSTINVWTYVSHSGNLDGEDFDVDGATACGQVRWSDSACLLTEQTHYRWRNDDGGLGVSPDEWFNTNWDARKQVRIENVDATTYTDAVVELSVEYDSDMQADFDDLRFTDSSGTTTLSYWVGSTTNSTVAEVWVKVPTLPANDITSIFMYYNNATAVSSSSASSTFIVADDFEDGNISEYSGETVDFVVGGTYAHNGSYGLDASVDETGQTESGGMYNISNSSQVSQGETIQYQLYIKPAEADEVCTMFGIQTSGAPASNYAVCTDLNGTPRLVLVRDVVDNAPSGTQLDTTNVTLSEGWYEIEVDWGTDDGIDVSMYDAAGTLKASLSASDSNYESGGIGFTFWYQHGGWDSLTSRPTLTTEPTVLFGLEQTDGGATWAAALDTTAGDFSPGDIARLRLAIENTGTAITNQQFLLEYAEQGAAPSCESVSTSNYAAVPVQASCGTSPVCMQSSSNVTNGASTVDLLLGIAGTFTAGEAREDPSNSSGNLNIAQDEYTELEYVVTPTVNVGDPNLCFRVTNNGTEYDSYLKIAKMNVRFDPSFGTVAINGGVPISLTSGTTTRVYATSTVTDLNGYADIILGSSTMFTTAAGAACSADNNNCYISTTASECSYTDCSGNSCTLECYADVYFHADATDDDGGQEWFAFLEAEDTQGGIDFATSPGIEMYTLRAIGVDEGIDYGALSANSDTGTTNPTTTVTNQGNVAVDVQIEGTDLTDGVSSNIPAGQQKFATSSFNYSACVICSSVPTTSPPTLEVDLIKPITDAPPVADDVYWGIAVPIGTHSTAHQGTNIFTPVSD